MQVVQAEAQFGPAHQRQQALAIGAEVGAVQPAPVQEAADLGVAAPDAPAAESHFPQREMAREEAGWIGIPFGHAGADTVRLMSPASPSSSAGSSPRTSSVGALKRSVTSSSAGRLANAASTSPQTASNAASLKWVTDWVSASTACTLVSAAARWSGKYLRIMRVLLRLFMLPHRRAKSCRIIDRKTAHGRWGLSVGLPRMANHDEPKRTGRKHEHASTEHLAGTQIRLPGAA